MTQFFSMVLVTLIDDATGENIQTSSMASIDLPESFENEFETTLYLVESDWRVVHAEPQTRKEYTESGTLTLRLRKLESVATETILYSQADYTDRFDDKQRLNADEWIKTLPLNAIVKNPESVGLPSPDADMEEVYRIASRLSGMRESVPIPGDGVYCPICHIANIDLGKLRTPCPQCERELLKFGWD